MAEGELPTEEEVREALGRVGVSDVLVNALSATASLGFHRVSAETRDLPQARLAIEALRALEPVLREGGVEESVLRDLEEVRLAIETMQALTPVLESIVPHELVRDFNQSVANLQLAYASAVAEATEPTEPAEAAPADVPEEDPAEAQSAVGEEPPL